MDKPENYTKIITGRASLENWLKIHYPDFFDFLNKNFSNFDTLQSKIYAYYNNITSWPLCPICGKRVKFHGYTYGFGKFCSPTCAGKDEEVQNKVIESKIKNYGKDYKKIIFNKTKQTCIERYGVENAMQCEDIKERVKQTCIERYGVENAMQCEDIKEKSKQTCLEKYGSEYYLSSNQRKNKNKEIKQKYKETSLKNFGTDFPMQCEDIKERVKQTCIERYGVPWNCMRDEAHNSKNSKSTYNCKMSEILIKNNINFSTEFPINNNLYDFKIGNILLEVNPSATHNINWSPFNKKCRITKEYHNNKSNIAKENNYRCIHLWEWDPIDIILDILNTNKKKIYARNCTIKEIKKDIIDNFLEINHLQGSCRGQKIKLGLFYNNELIEVMTFGKPKNNKNYEYELLRLCTKIGYSVIGGSNKLFLYFKNKYNPESIISYCDKSKFDGTVYNTLGFNLINISQPACHWYNIKTKQHITDNLLRKLGASNIIGTKFGKGISNEKIMLENNFVQIYDCGQYVFEYKKPI